MLRHGLLYTQPAILDGVRVTGHHWGEQVKWPTILFQLKSDNICNTIANYCGAKPFGFAIKMPCKTKTRPRNEVHGSESAAPDELGFDSR